MHPLKKAILMRGYTINELARLANVPVSNIYNITRDRGKVGNMGIESFRRISHVLGLSMDDLLKEIEDES